MSGLTFQLFAKAPVAGTVKTRLFPLLAPQVAAALQARMTEHAARMIAAARLTIPHSSAELWCTPDTRNEILQAIASRHDLILRQQPAGDLGMRMRFALDTAMPDSAILLGSDCPMLDAPALVSAAHLLDAHDAVFAPVEDGGYALVGCRGAVPDCFRDIDWSTGEVMARTRARLTTARARWAELPVAWDVDTAADFMRLGTDARFSHLVAGLAARRGTETEQQMGQLL